jgi:hypothetical protein
MSVGSGFEEALKVVLLKREQILSKGSMENRKNLEEIDVVVRCLTSRRTTRQNLITSRR